VIEFGVSDISDDLTLSFISTSFSFPPTATGLITFTFVVSWSLANYLLVSSPAASSFYAFRLASSAWFFRYHHTETPTPIAARQTNASVAPIAISSNKLRSATNSLMTYITALAPV
jgi:hypothetical protein